MIKTVEWTDSGVRLIDQTKLPTEETYVICSTWEEVANAIKTMIVRGAPAIGIAAAMGIAVGVRDSDADHLSELRRDFAQICEEMGETRPTAVNLFWAIRRMQDKFESVSDQPIAQIRQVLVTEAQRIYIEDLAANEMMSKHGATLLPASGTVLTHCNAGALATGGGYGTALGVIRAAIEAGKKLNVYADETRPFLQGARLTAWELMKDGIATTVISDNMAGSMMKQGKISAVVVGADRVAANGDVANKIGTYPLSVLAREHNIPFYVAAPWSTIDLETPDGDHIPIEQRSPREVTHLAGKQITPDGVKVENPAFDVTPAKYITAIITELGIARAPFTECLAKMGQAAKVA
ncbi:MAG: S-methyl-5-thioribose-1-phosphate isomerase [Acidobacteriaceae bacterium]|nr:S-methyl-5-thioribose-1-phosphate isomerase [Acidobacteriaceae bacterium]